MLMYPALVSLARSNPFWIYTPHLRNEDTAFVEERIADLIPIIPSFELSPQNYTKQIRQ